MSFPVSPGVLVCVFGTHSLEEALGNSVGEHLWVTKSGTKRRHYCDSWAPPPFQANEGYLDLQTTGQYWCLCPCPSVQNPGSGDRLFFNDKAQSLEAELGDSV